MSCLLLSPRPLQVTNSGTLSSAPILLSDIPATAPIASTTLFPLAPLAPGDSADIVFTVTLPADTPVGSVFSGSLSVVSGLNSYPLSLHFTCSTNVTGSLTVEVVDEVGLQAGRSHQACMVGGTASSGGRRLRSMRYSRLKRGGLPATTAAEPLVQPSMLQRSFLTAEKPKLANATVQLVNAVGSTVASGTSGSDGLVTLSNIAEGLYQLLVSWHPVPAQMRRAGALRLHRGGVPWQCTAELHLL